MPPSDEFKDLPIDDLIDLVNAIAMPRTVVYNLLRRNAGWAVQWADADGPKFTETFERPEIRFNLVVHGYRPTLREALLYEIDRLCPEQTDG